MFFFLFRIYKAINICVSIYHLHLHTPTALSSPMVGAVITNRVYSPLERLFKDAVHKASEVSTLSSAQKRANHPIAGISEYFLFRKKKKTFSIGKL